MPSHNPSTENQKDDKGRERQGQQGQHGSPDDQESQDSHIKGPRKGKNDNPGNFANDPDRARKSGQKGGQS
jgi:hypothetical protein